MKTSSFTFDNTAISGIPFIGKLVSMLEKEEERPIENSRYAPDGVAIQNTEQDIAGRQPLTFDLNALPKSRALEAQGEAADYPQPLWRIEIAVKPRGPYKNDSLYGESRAGRVGGTIGGRMGD